MPGAGRSVPAHQERGTGLPGQRQARQPAGPCSRWSMVYPAASSPPPAPGQAPAWLPPPPQPWPGAQPGPGGQSYCKRPGRPEAWTLPAGRSRRHLPLPGSAGRGRALRPPPGTQAAPGAEGGAESKHRPCQDHACVHSRSPSPAPLLGHRPCPPGCSCSSLSLPPLGRSWQGRGLQQPAPLHSNPISRRRWVRAPQSCHFHQMSRGLFTRLGAVSRPWSYL